MKAKNIICHHCHKHIKTKEELSVVGNAFHTYHNRCFEDLKGHNIYAFYSGYKLNGYFPWIMIIILNILLWGTYILVHSPLNEVLIMSLFISSLLFFYRISAYFLYERYY